MTSTAIDALEPAAWLVQDKLYRDQVFIDRQKAQSRAEEREMNSDVIDLFTRDQLLQFAEAERQRADRAEAERDGARKAHRDTLDLLEIRNRQINEASLAAQPQAMPRREDGVTEFVTQYSKFISDRPALISLLYDIDMLPEQTVTYAGAVRLAGLCEVWKRGEAGKLTIAPVSSPLPTREAELEEALTWYEAQARGCRKVTSEGNIARSALNDDAGAIARAALGSRTNG